MLLEFFDKYTVTGWMSLSGPCKLVGPNKKFEGPGMNVVVEGDKWDDDTCGSGDEEEELWGYEFEGDVLGETFGVVEDEKYEKRLLPEKLLVKPLNDDTYKYKFNFLKSLSIKY